MAAPSSKLTVVFTPGAWHGPWAFKDVCSKVSALGFETSVGELASVGSTDVSVGLLKDAAGIRAKLLEHIDAGKEVLLVAHSYGGVVSSNAVKGLSVQQRKAAGQQGGIVMILYLAAFAIPAGTSLLDGLNGVPPPWWNVGADDLVTPRDPLKVFYEDVESSVAATCVQELRTESLAAFKEKSTYAPWSEGFEVGYVFAEQDQAIPLEVQKFMFGQFPAGSFTASLNASHSLYISMPEAVAGIIAAAASHALSKR